MGCACCGREGVAAVVGVEAGLVLALAIACCFLERIPERLIILLLDDAIGGGGVILLLLLLLFVFSVSALLFSSLMLFRENIPIKLLVFFPSLLLFLLLFKLELLLLI